MVSKDHVCHRVRCQTTDLSRQDADVLADVKAIMYSTDCVSMIARIAQNLDMAIKNW